MTIRSRLILFAAGDFAFNLYWQAVGLYLLFFYIDVLALPPAVAGAVFTIGALWDGIADLAVGALAQRRGVSYRRWVGRGAVPLGAGFVAMFAAAGHGAGWLLAAQLAFRTAYAFTNVPYAAWTTRLSGRSEDRTLLAGLRMMFGALAAIAVAAALPVLAARLGGGGMAGFPLAAALLAILATPLLLLVAVIVPEPVGGEDVADPVGGGDVVDPVDRGLRGQMAALLANRAFVTLNLAAAAGGAAAALLGQSVLYYYRYGLGDSGGGPRTLAAMALASVVFVPFWTWLATRVGARATWLIAGVGAMSLLSVAALLPLDTGMATALFLVAMQAAFGGFQLAAWAMLPDTVDWGERQRGVRVEALAFGTFAFAQKAALAGAGLMIGMVYAASGFVAGASQPAGAVAAIRWLMLAGPAVLIALSVAAILANPLRPATPLTIRPA
ncbi:MFS transporter [Sphingomonas sp. CFBP 8760]|uniref:MFS transporter n=1 Tax=Sphingomonas sp. CFBP 8760 TaxID=2775282 RepID=UPI00314558BB